MRRWPRGTRWGLDDDVGDTVETAYVGAVTGDAAGSYPVVTELRIRKGRHSTGRP